MYRPLKTCNKSCTLITLINYYPAELWEAASIPVFSESRISFCQHYALVYIFKSRRSLKTYCFIWLAAGLKFPWTFYFFWRTTAHNFKGRTALRAHVRSCNQNFNKYTMGIILRVQKLRHARSTGMQATSYNSAG